MQVKQTQNLVSTQNKFQLQFRLYAEKLKYDEQQGKSQIPKQERNWGNFDTSKINIIPGSLWGNGTPAILGGHLMGSNNLAPLTKSNERIQHKFQFSQGLSVVSVTVYDSQTQNDQGLTTLILNSYKEAISSKGSFTLVLSGGSLVKLVEGLSNQSEIDWSKVWIFFADERNVSHDAPDSTIGQYKQSLFRKVKLNENQIIAIRQNVTVDQAATSYEGQLIDLPENVLPRNSYGFPVFDIILLGIGPDGHCASLFPNHVEIMEKDRWVLPIKNSPKPPPERITLSLAVLNSAKKCVFPINGKGKSEIVQRVLEHQSLPGALPSQLVRPIEGEVIFSLDQAAASKLNIKEWENKKAYPRNE